MRPASRIPHPTYPIRIERSHSPPHVHVGCGSSLARQPQRRSPRLLEGHPRPGVAGFWGRKHMVAVPRGCVSRQRRLLAEILAGAAITK
jgi:hypothetical protein